MSDSLSFYFVLCAKPFYQNHAIDTFTAVSYCSVVVSKCSQNHFISEKYKAVQSFKLHFLVQLYTSAINCEGVGNIPKSHFVKAFSALLSHSEWCQQHHKSPVPSMLISVKGTGKNQQQPGQKSMADAPVLSHCSWLWNPWPKTNQYARALSWRRNQLLVLHFSWNFLLTVSLRWQRMSMPTYETESPLKQQFPYIIPANSCKLYWWIPRAF